MKEAALEFRFKKEVEKHGCKALKFMSPNKRGMQDRIVLFPGGKVVFVELKTPGKKPTPLQAKRATELRKMGFRVYCVDTVSAIDEFIAKEFDV